MRPPATSAPSVSGASAAAHAKRATPPRLGWSSCDKAAGSGSAFEGPSSDASDASAPPLSASKNAPTPLFSRAASSARTRICTERRTRALRQARAAGEDDETLRRASASLSAVPRRAEGTECLRKYAAATSGWSTERSFPFSSDSGSRSSSATRPRSSAHRAQCNAAAAPRIQASASSSRSIVRARAVSAETSLLVASHVAETTASSASAASASDSGAGARTRNGQNGSAESSGSAVRVRSSESPPSEPRPGSWLFARAAPTFARAAATQARGETYPGVRCTSAPNAS